MNDNIKITAFVFLFLTLIILVIVYTSIANVGEKITCFIMEQERIRGACCTFSEQMCPDEIISSIEQCTDADVNTTSCYSGKECCLDTVCTKSIRSLKCHCTKYTAEVEIDVKCIECEKVETTIGVIKYGFVYKDVRETDDFDVNSTVPCWIDDHGGITFEGSTTKPVLITLCIVGASTGVALIFVIKTIKKFAF